MTVSATPAPPGRAARPSRRRGWARGWIGWGFTGPFLAVFALVFLAPIGYSVYLSLFQDRLIGGDSFVGLANYQQAMDDPQFWAALGRVTLFLAVQVPIMLGFMYGSQFGLVADLNHTFGVTLPDPLSPHLVLASIGNIVTWEFMGYNMLIFYAALRVVPHALYEAASIDGAGQWRIVTAIKLPAIRGALVIATIFSIIGSFQLFNEPSILKSLAPNAISTYFTPNLYTYSLSFSGQQHNYAATVAIITGLLTMVIAYVFQLRGMRKEA